VTDVHPPPGALPEAIVVMGVSGSGKTTVGRLLAERLERTFVDADDLHPPENVAKMEAGRGLTDADRAPWLARVRDVLDAHRAAGLPLVMACSALKRAYRERLGVHEPGVRFVWLDVPTRELRQRLAERADHFADEALLPSQLGAFEPPTAREATRVTADGTPADTAGAALAALAGWSAAPEGPAGNEGA
jgi:gluconokinase